VRSFLFSMLMLGGCAADTEVKPPPPSIDVSAARAELAEVEAGSQDGDVCALAAELPTDDICSLICDPVEMAARMVGDGNDRGACYQLYCGLPDGSHVLVGVCLPP
jgi:hypothetical protein